LIRLIVSVKRFSWSSIPSKERGEGVLSKEAMPVRLKDIAKHLGISTVAVCKALKGDRDISEATRKRVLQCVKEFNYHPNLLARGLIVGRSKTIGVVIPEMMHSFFAEIAAGVAREVQASGYTLLLANSDEDPQVERTQVEMLLARKVDGLILASAQPTGDLSLFQDLQHRNVPFVLLDRRFPNLEANFVGVDNVALGEMATGHLLQRGCRRVGHLSRLGVATGPGRMAGYRSALSSAGIPVEERWIVDTDGTDDSGYRAMRTLLDVRPRLQGVFCFNDPVAARAIKAVLDAGLRVPEDIAIVGGGNVRYSDLLRVPLTTVDQGPAEMGARAARIVLHEIHSGVHAHAGTVLIPLKLIERESSQRPSGRRPARAGKGDRTGVRKRRRPAVVRT
jgi:LacI family transcriptional regulator